MIRTMNRTRALIVVTVAGVALVFGGVVGAFAAVGTLTPGTAALAALAATSPSPSFRSNEDPAHERNESAAQEQAENNGTAHHNCPHSQSGSRATSTSSNA